MKKIVVMGFLVVVVVFSGVFWWSTRDTRDRKYLSHCMGNMRQIDAAKEQYAAAHNLTKGAVVTRQQIAEYIKCGWRHFDCYPAGGDKYDIGQIGEDPRCPVHGSLSDVHLSGRDD